MKAFRYKEMKLYQHDVGHMTKLVAMRLCGKNPLKISPLEPVDELP